jgi:hypothetical protein
VRLAIAAVIGIPNVEEEDSIGIKNSKNLVKDIAQTHYVFLDCVLMSQLAVEPIITSPVVGRAGYGDVKACVGQIT